LKGVKNMKKKIAALSIITGIIASGTIYPAAGLVTETDSNYATIELSNGHLFQVETEDNETGDFLTCIMYNSGTPEDVTDDIILTYRYAGTLERFIEINERS
jgi:hypothetical protein